MRWDNLFDDLERQLEREKDSVVDHQVLDEERQRQAALTMQQRLKNLTPTELTIHQNPDGKAPLMPVPLMPVRLTLTSGMELSLQPIRHGRNWCAVDVLAPTSLAGQGILALAAIAHLTLTPLQVATSLGSLVRASGEPSALSTEPSTEPSTVPPKLADRIGLSFVLRDLSRRRRTVEIHARQGIYRGTIDRVSADHCDIAEHPGEEPRRNANVRRFVVVALSQVLFVRVL